MAKQKSLRILCIGSAHLDIISTILGDSKTLDRIGTTCVEVGGTACNVAINLARLDVHTTLLTALDSGGLSDVVVRHVEESGVDLRIQKQNRSDRTIAAFCAHMGEDGELLSAVSSMPTESARFAQDKLRGRWDAIFIDANLHSREIARLAQKFPKTKVFLAAVSEEKSMRLVEALPNVTGIFINAREMRYLEEHSGLTPEIISAKYCTVFHTKSAEGADIWVCGVKQNIPAARVAKTGNRLGAGDALAASTIYHMCLGAPAVEALRASMPYALKVAESINANNGGTAPLERAIMTYKQQAFVDVLTGIPNRSAGLRRAAEISGAKDHVVGVAIVDVDKFKSINDELGHDAGDLALKAVAKALMSVLRKCDFGCRWGGEEFTCFIEGKTEAEVLKAAERIREAISSAADVPRKITASIGVSMWKTSTPLDDAINLADKALYHAKNNGRNQVVLSSTLTS